MYEQYWSLCYVLIHFLYSENFYVKTIKMTKNRISGSSRKVSRYVYSLRKKFDCIGDVDLYYGPYIIQTVTVQTTYYSSFLQVVLTRFESRSPTPDIFPSSSPMDIISVHRQEKQRVSKEESRVSVDLVSIRFINVVD